MDLPDIYRAFIPKTEEYAFFSEPHGTFSKTNQNCSSRVLEFNSQQPLTGSQTYIMMSVTLFWCAGIHAGRTLYIINNKSFLKKARKERKKKETTTKHRDSMK